MMASKAYSLMAQTLVNVAIIVIDLAMNPSTHPRMFTLAPTSSEMATKAMMVHPK